MGSDSKNIWLFGFLFIGVCGIYVFGWDGLVDVKFWKF